MALNRVGDVSGSRSGLIVQSILAGMSRVGSRQTRFYAGALECGGEISEAEPVYKSIEWLRLVLFCMFWKRARKARYSWRMVVMHACT